MNNAIKLNQWKSVSFHNQFENGFFFYLDRKVHTIQNANTITADDFPSFHVFYSYFSHSHLYTKSVFFPYFNQILWNESVLIFVLCNLILILWSPSRFTSIMRNEQEYTYINIDCNKNEWWPERYKLILFLINFHRNLNNGIWKKWGNPRQKLNSFLLKFHKICIVTIFDPYCLSFN